MSKQQLSKEKLTTAMRIDKWLWAARFYKTRSLAQEMVNGGKVHINGQRCKPGRKIETGMTIHLWQGEEEKELQVLGLSEKRLSAPLAQALYQETEQSQQQRAERAEQRRLLKTHSSKDQRPDKKQRRQLLSFKNQNE